MRWVKSTRNEALTSEYQQLKVHLRLCADKACEEWWEEKAKEAQKL